MTDSAHTLAFAPQPCPACPEPGALVERGEETTVGYMGPHDGNCVRGVFQCPRGHRFYAVTQRVCSCGWSGVKDCTICDTTPKLMAEGEPSWWSQLANRADTRES